MPQPHVNPANTPAPSSFTSSQPDAGTVNSVTMKTEDTFFDKVAKIVWNACHTHISTFPQLQHYWPSYLAAFVVKKGAYAFLLYACLLDII